MRKKERKICQRFVRGEKDARHAATRRHTHTHRERERCREKKEPPSLSLSSAKKQKNTQLITPLLQAPILSERTDRNEWRSRPGAPTETSPKTNGKQQRAMNEKSLALLRFRLSMQQRTGKRERERERDVSRGFFSFPERLLFTFLFIRKDCALCLSLSERCVALLFEGGGRRTRETTTTTTTRRENDGALSTRARAFICMKSRAQQKRAHFSSQKDTSPKLQRKRKMNPKLNSNAKP